MTINTMGTRTPDATEEFGPIKRHLSAGAKDHAKGWEEKPKHRGQGGHVAPINPKRVVTKSSLAEQFAKRMAEGKDVKR
jgi:hypothetical protein